jgi:SAM-dependent methyltransferase
MRNIYLLLLFATAVLLYRAWPENRKVDRAKTAKAQDIVSNETIFTRHYETGEWSKGADGMGNSGTGSDPQNARMYIHFLQNYLLDRAIESVVDLGCGDWRINRNIDWDGIQYLGIDVVESVIQENSREFSSENISFVKADGIDYTLPKADLLICKDVLQHLPFQDIQSIVKQFGQFKHCIIINDVDPAQLTCENVDMPRGYYRCLDLTKPPFSLSGRKVLTYASGMETKQLVLIDREP